MNESRPVFRHQGPLRQAPEAVTEPWLLSRRGLVLLWTLALAGFIAGATLLWLLYQA